MKISWGTSIIISFALFISFILYFVFKVQTNSKYDNELVVDEYYKKDAKFGAEMLSVQNAEDLTEKPVITTSNGEISISFPKQFDSKKVNGTVSLYRPSNKKLDFEIPLSLTNSTLLIPKKSLVGGRWDITIEWEYDGKLYTTKEDLYLR
ncbi:MAG: FixH family protein [Flavobacterium sp.]|nr:FixH family protein [Flavobacterium sp.]